MNNEPVAWMSEFGQFIGKVQDEICHIPLYTHPVKEQLKEVELEATFNRGYKEGARDYANKCNPVKEYFEDEPQAEELYEILQSNVELTDEEKWKLWSECPNGLVYDRVMMFADLILRKAQEK